MLAGLLLVFAGTLLQPAEASDQQLKLNDVVLTWSSTFTLPKFREPALPTMRFTNNSKVEVRTAAYSVKDNTGREVDGSYVLRLLPNRSQEYRGRWEGFSNPPYTMTLSLTYYDAQGGKAAVNPNPVTTVIQFRDASGSSQSPAPSPSATQSAIPTPAPTVTITETPEPIYITNPADKRLSDLVAKLMLQIKSLSVKLEKICSAKPKPKNC